jgi:hypothetical protein
MLENLQAELLLNDKARASGLFCCVPSMIDSLGVKVFYPA